MALSYIFTIRLHPEAAFVLMSVAASFGSDFARLSLDQVLTVPALFSPQRESYVLLSPVSGLSATGRP